MRAHGLIALVLPLAACEQLTPLENFSCGDLEAIALTSELEAFSADVLVVDAASVAAGVASIALRDERPDRVATATLRFPVVEGRAPRLPLAGDAVAWTASGAAGFGEGEDMAVFTIDGVVSVGRLNGADDVDSRDQHDRMRLVAVDADAVCADGGRAAAAVSLRHDGGTTTFLPGDTAAVVIDGAPHALLVGAAERREFDFPQQGPCPDCPSPGRHFDVGVDVVLYRVAE